MKLQDPVKVGLAIATRDGFGSGPSLCRDKTGAWVGTAISSRWGRDGDFPYLTTTQRGLRRLARVRKAEAPCRTQLAAQLGIATAPQPPYCPGVLEERFEAKPLCPDCAG